MKLNGTVSVKPGCSGNATLRLAANELAGLTSRRFGKDSSAEAVFSIEPGLPSFEVCVSGGKICIAAPDPVEILYGVYDFAEKFLGYCFFEPGRDILSKSGAVELPDGIIIPARPVPFKIRGFVQEFPFDSDSTVLADWMAKNKLNFLNFWMKYYDEISEETRQAFLIRGIEMHSGHHSFDYWIPANKYYRKHPEFFAEYGGVRTRAEEDSSALMLSKQLCTTNPGLRKEIVRNMAEYAGKHPEVRTLSLSPNDGFGWCECSECSKFYDKDKKGELYSLSSHVYLADRIYHDMIGDVGRQLEAERPGLKINFFAYVNYCRPAPGFKLAKNLQVSFAPYWRCINHDIDDPACPFNSRYAGDIKAWCEAKQGDGGGGEVLIYEYYMGVNFYLSLPQIHHHAVFKEAEFYKALGVDGVITQFHIPHWSVYGLNFKAMAHALRGDDGQVFNDWIMNALFGRDAAEAERFYQALQDLLLSAGKCHITYPYALFSRTAAGRYEKLLQQAKALAAKDSASAFRRELVIWMEYLYRFKTVFDGYHAGNAGIAEIDELQKWIHAHAGTRVFVHNKFDIYFEAWRTAIRENKQWLHFNLAWEDEYIRQHEKLLK